MNQFKPLYISNQSKNGIKPIFNKVVNFFLRHPLDSKITKPEISKYFSQKLQQKNRAKIGI